MEEDDPLASRVRARLAAVTESMGAVLPTLSRSTHTELAAQIDELDGDALLLDLLSASVESNVETFLHFARYGIPIEEIEAPPAALEYGRRIAQRGISSHALQRAYRLGQRHVMSIAHAEISRTETDREVALAAGMALLDLAFAYIDAVSGQVVAEYEAERERWLATRSNARITALGSVLAGEDTDVVAAEKALGYRLRQHHVAVVAWSPDPLAGVGPLPEVERVLDAVARRIGAGPPLVVPRDAGSADAWIPLGRHGTSLDTDALAAVVREHGARTLLAFGGPGTAVAGFVTSHREARRAHLVATTAGDRADVVTAWTSPGVRTAALLATELAMTRDLVATALGPLGADDEGMARLRETLRVFLDERRSYLATAEQVHLHKNTVKYRVDKAVDARGRGLDEDRLDLELALLACRHLGRSVLTT